MPSIPENEFNTQGVTAIQQALQDNKDVIIPLRGENKYDVMGFEQYKQINKSELEAAIHKTRKRIAEGELV